jgi:hypothetical protein
MKLRAEVTSIKASTSFVLILFSEIYFVGPLPYKICTVNLELFLTLQNGKAKFPRNKSPSGDSGDRVTVARLVTLVTVVQWWQCWQ